MTKFLLKELTFSFSLCQSNSILRYDSPSATCNLQSMTPATCNLQPATRYLISLVTLYPTFPGIGAGASTNLTKQIPVDVTGCVAHG